MTERKKTADDVVRRIASYFARDETPPVLIGPSGAVGGTGTEPRPVGFKNPMTAVGDLIRGGTAGAAARLPIGTAGQVLTVVVDRPGWADATGGSGATRDLLTNGDATAPELIFAGGDVIWIEG